MPVYCYTTADGKTVERTYHMGKAPRRIKVEGEPAERNIRVEHLGPRASPGAWPMVSDAAGCHPDQIPEMREALRAQGVDCEFDREGGAIFTSAAHRKRVCEAMGLYDRNGGYGDPRKRN